MADSLLRRHARTAVRLVTDSGLALWAIRRALDLSAPLKGDDRKVLERLVFHYYAAQPDVKKVLFVGCRWYTSNYDRAFANHAYWTLEPDPELRRYGGSRHVVAPLEELDDFFAEDYFDLILCNGVLGYGLDSLEQCERAFSKCHSCLRAGGHFVLGWNDISCRRPCRPDRIESLGRFRRFIFPAFGSWRHLTKTSYRHTYDFYMK